MHRMPFLRGLVLLALVLVTLLAAWAQPTPWQARMQAAQQAERAGRYEAAVTLYQEALAEAENIEQRIESQAGVALVYRRWGKVEESVRAYRTTLAMQEKEYGADSPRLIETLKWLAWQLQSTQATEAEKLLQRALPLADAGGATALATASGLRLDLASLYTQQKGKIPDAEALFLRAIADYEKSTGPGSPALRSACSIAARSCCNAGAYATAEPLYQKWLAVTEKANGPFGDEIGEVCHDIARLYRLQGREKDAEPYLKRAGEVSIKRMGETSPDDAIAMAACVLAQGRVEEAAGMLPEPVSGDKPWRIARRARELTTRALLAIHRNLEVLQGHGALLRPGVSLRVIELTLTPPIPPPDAAQRAAVRQALAATERDLRDVVTLRAQDLAAYKDPYAMRKAMKQYDLALARNNLAACLVLENKDTEAETLLRQAIAQCTEARAHLGKPVGQAHPGNQAADASPMLTNLAVLLYRRGGTALPEALRLLTEARGERAKMRNLDLPANARGWLSLAVAKKTAGDARGAADAMREALALFTPMLGADAEALAPLRTYCPVK